MSIDPKLKSVRLYSRIRSWLIVVASVAVFDTGTVVPAEAVQAQQQTARVVPVGMFLELKGVISRRPRLHRPLTAV
jgi:hypothetical protein